LFKTIFEEPKTAPAAMTDFFHFHLFKKTAFDDEFHFSFGVRVSAQ